VQQIVGDIHVSHGLVERSRVSGISTHYVHFVNPRVVAQTLGMTG
jgi:hypothetical protein